MFKTKSKRDVTFIKRPGDKTLVIACDSAGAIGNKSLDILKVSPKVVGYYTARVALMEVLSVGATPIAVINTLSVEMNPTGQEIIEGIKKLMMEAEIPLTCINGSTEENFNTLQTGMGITIIGEVEDKQCKINRTEVEDIVYLLGEPKVGGEIKIPYDPNICSLKDLKVLVESEDVKEIIPIGSKGIIHESQLLAEINNLTMQYEENIPVNITKSGGPATAVIFTIAPGKEKKLFNLITTPFCKIGKVVK